MAVGHDSRTGQLNVAGGTIGGISGLTLERDMVVAGDLDYTIGHLEVSSERGTIQVAAGGSFTSTGVASRNIDTDLVTDVGGIFRHTSTGTTRLGITNVAFLGRAQLTNNGTVRIEAGTFSLFGDGAGTGDFDVAEGTWQIAGGTHAYTGNFIGAGTAQFSGGTVDINGAGYSIANLEVDGATVNFNSTTFGPLDSAVLSGGTANFNTASSVDLGVVTLSGATLGGNDGVDVMMLDWTSGGIASGGTLAVDGGSLGGIGGLRLDRTIRVTGELEHTQNNLSFTTIRGAIQLADGGTFSSSGTLARNIDVDVIIDVGGTFRHTSTGTTSLGITNDPSLGRSSLTNSGSFDVDAGIVEVRGPFTNYDATNDTLSEARIVLLRCFASRMPSFNQTRRR